MNTAHECEQTLLVQAEFDGELDAAQAATLVRHREGCSQCQAVQQQLARSRALMRAAPRFTASEKLRAAIVSSPLVERPKPRPAVASRWWTGLGLGTAVAASVLLAVLVLRPVPAQIGDQLVSSHLRAMQLESHLIDVVSADHHTVKPWFAGKVDFAPPVKQLDADGYVLKGGRIDVVNSRTAAVLVYQAGRHVVDVYIWPASSNGLGVLHEEPISGFNLRNWREGGLEVWCVSDMGDAELDRFAERWRASK